MRKSTGAVLLLVLVLALAGIGCGSGGGGDGGSGDDLIISGVVRSPDGEAISPTPIPGPAPLPLSGVAQIDVPGLVPVPDGTPVDLARLDGDGNVLETVASRTTIDGDYRFDLDNLGLEHAADLAVIAGEGASRMRALAVRRALDVDPISEAGVRLMLDQGAGFANYTRQEGSNFAAALDLLVITEKIADQGDIESTVALVEQVVADDNAVTAFLAAASEPGQTDAGPGDVGDFFPYQVGNAWSMLGTNIFDSGEPTTYENVIRVLELDDDVFTVEESNALDIGEAVREFFEETTTAIVYHGGEDAEPPIDALVPFDEVRFPLRTGRSFEQYDEDNLLLEDLDRDGRVERVDVKSERELIGFEDITVPAGIFENAAQLETVIKAEVDLTTGGNARVTTTINEWFAPGVGLVRADTKLKTTVRGDTTRDEYSEVLDTYQAGDTGRGAVPSVRLAADVSRQNSDTLHPGPPGVGFDGENYLVVTCRDLSDDAELVGIRVSQLGVVLVEFPIITLAPVGCRGRFPHVVFDGINFLIVYQDSQVRGIRITPEGVVLDPVGFDISSSGTSNAIGDVSFDGTNTLVVWRRYSNESAGDVYGAFVTQAGVSLGGFEIYAGAGDQVFVKTEFGGGNHLVLWENRSIDGNTILGARVTPAGVVLDPAGVTIADGPQADGDFEPDASFDGTHFYVIWLRDNPPPMAFHRIYGIRVNTDATLADVSPTVISPQFSSVVGKTIEFDGENHFVVWENAQFDEDGGVRAARVIPTGELLDGPDLEDLLVIARGARRVRLLYPRLAFGNRNSFMVWMVSTAIAGEAKDIDGAVIFPY